MLHKTSAPFSSNFYSHSKIILKSDSVSRCGNRKHVKVKYLFTDDRH